MFLLAIVLCVMLLEIHDINGSMASLMTGLLAGLSASLLTLVILSLPLRSTRREFAVELKSAHYSLMHLLIFHHLTFGQDDVGSEQFTDFNNDCYNFIKNKVDNGQKLIYKTNDKTYSAVLEGVKQVQLQIPSLIGAYQYSFSDHLGLNFNKDLAELRLGLHGISPDTLKPERQVSLQNMGITFDYPSKLLGDYCKKLFKFVDKYA